jgi:large subunit ribosomal protein L25
MAEITVTADTGRPTGSRASGRLRAEGKVPGVVYGLGKDAVPVAVVWRDLRHALVGDAGLNALIDLHVDGGSELVMVKELQRHPVRRDVLHVDFLRVSRDQELTVDVPISLTGEATAVVAAEGVIEHLLHALPITAKPADIPNELSVDISGLELGDSIRVSDISLPSGVTTNVDLDEVVVGTSVSSAIEEPEPEEAEEGEEVEGAEGAEAEGAAPAEGATEGGAESGSSESE